MLNIINELWLKYNKTAIELADKLGRTDNIVGEYGEFIAREYYGGNLLDISNASADIKCDDGILYQVKTRKIKPNITSQLSIIRSWKFNYLVVILFNKIGVLIQAIEVPVLVAKEYAVSNSHQNGWVISTSKKFLSDSRNKDITENLNEIINK